MKCRHCGRKIPFLAGIRGQKTHEECALLESRRQAEANEKRHLDAKNRFMWGDISAALELAIMYALGMTSRGQDLPFAMAYFLFAKEQIPDLLGGPHPYGEQAFMEIQSQIEATGSNSELVARDAGKALFSVRGLFRICHAGSCPPPSAGMPPPGFERM